MINNVNQLVDTIKTLHPKSQTKLIAIDGISGAGKTTLALLLKKELEDVEIITTDDFWPEGASVVDTKLLVESVLEPLSEGKEGSFEEYNGNQSKKVLRTVNPGGTVIIEGIFSFHISIEHYYDYKIWIDVESENANTRNKNRGDNPEQIARLNEVRKMEIEYIETDKPKQRADLVVDNNFHLPTIPSLSELWQSNG